MATDVGSLNASLTLDLSNFRAGMSEAASLAAQLATQLQSVFAGDLGFSRMTAEILEMIAQVGNLSAAMESFRASLAAITGADMFAQMRTHTAALPSEIASITSGLISAQTAAAQLVMTMQSVATSAATVSASVAGMSLGSFSGATLDFSAPLAQIEQMQSAMAALFAQMERFNTVDMSTGEVMGSGDSAPAFTNILNITQQINATLQEVAASIQACTAATTEWATVTRQVSTMFGSIPDSLKAASAAAKSANTATKGAGSGASNFAGQTGKAAKNLQTSKGYAVSIKGILGGIIISQAFYQMVNIMQELISKAIEFSETLQDAAVAFNYLFQDSTQSADAFLNALKSMALVSPLDTTDLTAASRKLMAMGFSAEATVPTLQILTDTAAVFSNSAADMSDQIDHIALAFGQMIASGKVSAQELRQLYNAGLPIYELLSEGLGITLEQAKNIGDLGVDATSAVFAVLQELQQRYEGAAEALSHTLSGSISRIQEAFQQMLSYAWEAPFEKLTTIVDSAANHIVALVKITQAYGIGGLFQALFPESSWSVLRNFIGGLIQVGSVIKQFGQLFFTVFGDAIAIIIKVGSVVLPILANLANIILYLIRAAYNASPAVKILFQTIAVLAIGAVIAKVVVFLAKAIWLLTGAKAAAKAIGSLISAVITFGAANKAVIITVLALAAGLLAVVASSEKARAAIAAFFGSIGAKINDFAENLGFGFDTEDIAMPEFEMPDTTDYTAGLEDMAGAIDDVTDSTDAAGSSAKKNLQSFDQVFTIDDDASSGAGDISSSITDALGGLGDLDYSDLFDWTGDWATDWGNLSADLGDLGSLTDFTFEGIGTAIADFWNSLTGGDSNAGLVAIDAITLALVLLGKLKWAGALKVIEGIAEIALAIKDMVDNGIDVENCLAVIHGLTDIALGIGIFTGNLKLVGISLMIQGFTEIIQELAENWDAIRQGDWSGVSGATMIIAGLKILGGLALALIAFSKIKDVKKMADASKTVTEVTSATEQVSTATGGLSTKLTSLAKNLAMGLVIIVEVAAAALLIVGAIWLLGIMLEQVGIAWQPVIDNAGTIAIAMGIGIALLAVIGVVTAALGSVGTSLIVYMALGIAILAEMGVATGLFLVEIWAIGLLLQQIGEAWQPVLDNGETIATAIGLGTALLIAIGIVTAALGVATVATAGALPLAIALGTAILLEMGVATALFVIEIVAIGELLQQVGVAWQPVLDNGETIATGIELGTALLIAIGVVTAALGVASVASVGLLPLAIALGTAILVEMADALITFCESLIEVAAELSNNLAPALADLNGKLPDLTDDMNDFVAFMVSFAEAVASYSDAMGSLTWSSIVDAFRKFFTGSPIANLADDVKNIGNDTATLSDKLKIANPELETAVELLTHYNELMAALKLLQETGSVELASGMLTNLAEIGKNLVTGLVNGINDKANDAVNAVKDLAKKIVDGLSTGLKDEQPTAINWVTTFSNDFTNEFKDVFGISNNSSSKMEPYGESLVEGLLTGLSDAMSSVSSWLTSNVLNPIKSWASDNITTDVFDTYGVRVMTGFKNGMSSMRYSILLTVDSVFKAIKNRIADIFDIHSPSGITEGFGINLDQGMINGMVRLSKQLTNTAADISQDVVDNLTPDEVTAPTMDLSSVTNTSLTALQDWSTTFVTTIATTFNQIASLFDTLSARLSESMAGASTIPATLNVAAGSIAAADQIGATATTTGTNAYTKVIAEITEASLDSMADKISARMYEYLAPLFATLTSEDQSKVIAYVGTLIGDDAGLKELYRKLKVIQVSEGRRS